MILDLGVKSLRVYCGRAVFRGRLARHEGMSLFS